ncbi:hypothetical protein AGMMS50268_39900 [Spirochaetia bacterium]|nr:hypothetical protein AGMMS50268_39900 [Spirochaetia bacterium]
MRHKLYIFLQKFAPTIGKFVLRLFEGIVLATLIAGLTSIFSSYYNQKQLEKKVFDFTNKLIIGTNRNYVDQEIGQPYLIYTYIENAKIEDAYYKIPGAILRLVFRNNYAIAIFVTLTDNNYIGIYGSEKYRPFDEKKLGELAFGDVHDDFLMERHALGEHSMRISRWGYYFEVGFFGMGDYHWYLAGIEPFGTFIPPHSINNSSEIDLFHNNQDIGYMGNVIPNTYGVFYGNAAEMCALYLNLNVDITPLVSTYFELETEYFSTHKTTKKDILTAKIISENIPNTERGYKELSEFESEVNEAYPKAYHILSEESDDEWE